MIALIKNFEFFLSGFGGVGPLDPGSEAGMTGFVEPGMTGGVWETSETVNVGF